MTNMSGHERLELYEEARRLFLWAAGLAKHKGARQTIEDALREMRLAVAVSSRSYASEEQCDEGRRALDALGTVLFGVEFAALEQGGSRRSRRVAEMRCDLVEAITEWWLGRAAATELRAHAFRMALYPRPGRACRAGRASS